MNNNSPKISVGIAVYNGVEHISNALDSIVRQTYKNIKLVVVDGRSEDGTRNVLDEYARYISVLVCEPDKGIYDAMNKVCSLATGDWLIVLGCDDVLLDSFSRMPVLLDRPDTVYYGDVIKRSSGKIYGCKFSKYRLMRHNICHQALFYPKSVYRKYSYSRVRIAPNCRSRRSLLNQSQVSSDSRRRRLRGWRGTNPAGPVATHRQCQVLTMLRSNPNRRAAPLNPYSWHSARSPTGC